MYRCEHCEIRVQSDERFTYRGTNLCINCMEAFISWIIDGGYLEAPEMFDYIVPASELIAADEAPAFP